MRSHPTTRRCVSPALTARLLTNRAHALRRLDRVEEAVAELERTIALAPGFAEAHFELGMARLTVGDFARGWAAYEPRGATAAFAPNPARVQLAKPWTGAEPIAGKTFLLHAEQGLGDTIQLVRYVAPAARLGARVILEVQPEILSLLRKTEGAAAVIARGDKLPRFDLHCPLMSLPRAFAAQSAARGATVPYIEVPRAAPDNLAGPLTGQLTETTDGIRPACRRRLGGPADASQRPQPLAAARPPSPRCCATRDCASVSPAARRCATATTQSCVTARMWCASTINCRISPRPPP